VRGHGLHFSHFHSGNTTGRRDLVILAFSARSNSSRGAQARHFGDAPWTWPASKKSAGGPGFTMFDLRPRKSKEFKYPTPYSYPLHFFVTIGECQSERFTFPRYFTCKAHEGLCAEMRFSFVKHVQSSWAQWQA